MDIISTRRLQTESWRNYRNLRAKIRILGHVRYTSPYIQENWKDSFCYEFTNEDLIRPVEAVIEFNAKISRGIAVYVRACERRFEA